MRTFIFFVQILKVLMKRGWETMELEKCPEPDVHRSELVRGAEFSGLYEFPLVKATDFKPAKAIPFEKIYSTKECAQWVHFYTHDRQFERVWNRPRRYLEMFRKFDGVIAPDFSVYRDLPLAMQIWNIYRNRTLAYWMQSNGVNIVRNIRRGDERTYGFALEGVEQGGTVAEFV